MSTEPSYFNAYENFSLTRTAAGVLTVRLHTNGGPITFTGATHSQFPRVLEDIALDRDNQVVVLTGTGDSFMDAIDGPSLGDLTKPMGADVVYMEGRRIVGIVPGDGMHIAWEEVLGLNRARYLR